MEENHLVQFVKSFGALVNVVCLWVGSLVSMTLAGCDGGQKEETSGPQNVLSGNWTTAQGK